jgi:fructose-bisphosphate aldolase class II
VPYLKGLDVSLAFASDLIAAAVSSGRAVPAFNVVTLEHAEAVAAGAEAASSPALLQISENAIRYHGGRLEPILAACRETALASSAPLGLHLDHVEDLALVEQVLELGIAAGIGSIMFDASKLDYASNVELTASVAQRARAGGLWVEAELGEVGGKDGAHVPGVRTDPSEAARFVAATGVNGLAVAVGSSHGMLERSASLDFGLIDALAASARVPLVLHGSSGVGDADLDRAIIAGIRKVNVGTALNVAWTAGLRSMLDTLPDAVDPRQYSTVPRARVSELVAHLCRVIGAGPEA